MHSSGLLRSE